MLKLDPSRRQAAVDGRTWVKMTPREFGLLVFLKVEKGVQSKGNILKGILGNRDVSPQAVVVLVRRVREKLGVGVIVSHHGLGYELSE